MQLQISLLILACCHFCRFSPLSPVVDMAAVLSYNGK